MVIGECPLAASSSARAPLHEVRAGLTLRNGDFAKAAIPLWPRIERLLELGKRGAV
jgi:hypothetical protein